MPDMATRRSEEKGHYVWDQLLWILAPGAVVTIALAVVLMYKLTPPPHGAPPSPDRVTQVQ
jgi:hypothetical protein